MMFVKRNFSIVRLDKFPDNKQNIASHSRVAQLKVLTKNAIRCSYSNSTKGGREARDGVDGG